MESIDITSLFYTAHHLVAEINENGFPDGREHLTQEVQEFSENERKYTLMICVKPGETSDATRSSELNKHELIQCATELLTADPRPIGFEIFKRNVQTFLDKFGRAYLLGLGFRELSASATMMPDQNSDSKLGNVSYN